LLSIRYQENDSSEKGHYTATVKVGNKWNLAKNEKLEIVSAKKADKEATTEIVFYYLKAKSV
jgi:ubiquitin C-terminal hydrolase